MSQSFSNADGVLLFACTKCNSRHPFEDLSQGHQLCKDCKRSFQVIKCNYCRSEFQQENGTKPGSICQKCEQLQTQHGKPGPCAYCNIIAAFIGTKCQRCTNSEKKYGPPMSCEHCRQKCAFDRKDPESKKKVDGKVLCWLCTMAYKRTLAKARQKEAILKSSARGSSHHHISGGGDTKSFSSTSRFHGTSTSNGQHHNSTSSSAKITNHRSSHRTAQNSSHHRESSSANKKPRIDLSIASNGHISSNMASITETRFMDINNSDLSNVVTQLKDQIALLNKKLQIKEKELLSKDQQIADLKSTNTREQRELREKINTLQKQHTERISEMQAKLFAMQKQVAASNKAGRTPNPSSGYVAPPMVI